MSKLIVSANSFQHMETLLDKDVYGVLLFIAKLSVNSNFYVNVEEIENIDFKGKKKFIVMNKIMHNDDLNMVRDILTLLKDKECKILFYDIGVYNIALELGIAKTTLEYF